MQTGWSKPLTLKTSSSGLYKVQIGAFKVKANADSLASSAEAKGFDMIVVLKDGLYKVQIGAFSSKDNADALAPERRMPALTQLSF